MEQSDHATRSQQLVEPHNTYKRFFASVFKPFRKKNHRKTKLAQLQNDQDSLFRPYPVDPSTQGSAATLDNGGRLHQDASVTSDPGTPQTVEKNITSTFQDAHDVNISGNTNFLSVGKWNNVMNVHNYGAAHDLAPLKDFVSFGAFHDSSEQDPERQCHPGTRESILKQMRNWIGDPNVPERILWLHGPAGVGKSAIAQTISNSYGPDKLAATFFFFRSDPNRNDGNRLFPTLAWQITTSIPCTRDGIAHALSKNSDLPRKALEIQFEHLIFRPLKSIIDSFPQVEALSPVIVIDGVDECSGDKLQQRFLKTIGKAITDSRFPVRFLISSRPEAHIEETFDGFLSPVLRIDLAGVDGWRWDVELYLIEEFSRIALEQKLDAKTWPGQAVVHDFVDKSSGQFVYVSTIVRFVGDEYSSAPSQLEIIMGLKPADGASPFAYLDALYVEILQRQPHQKFLKDFLAILVARSLVESAEDLGKDDAMLLNVDVHELRRKLRGMHSVLKFKDYIDLHHRSFLDFLQDPDRSGQYHIGKQSSMRRYLELITNALVRYSSRIMQAYDCDGSKHFSPAFGELTSQYPRKIDLPLQDWEEVLQPLWSIKDDWLRSSKMSSPWKRGPCDECTFFYIIDNLLLHLSLFRGAFYSTSFQHKHLQPLEDVSCTSGETTKNMLGADHCRPGNSRECVENNSSNQNLTEAIEHSSNDLDAILASFLTMLRTIKSKTPKSTVMVDLMQTLLHFDPAEAASRICSVSDAESILDFIFNVYKKDQGMASNVARLALGIYARVPLLPPSLFIDQSKRIERHDMYQEKSINAGDSRINTMCQFAFMWGILSHNNICPLLGIYEGKQTLSCVYQNLGHENLKKWRDQSNPPMSAIKERLFEVAKAVQYIQSLGISIHTIMMDRVIIDSNSHAKVLGWGLSPQYCVETPYSDVPADRWTYDYNVMEFGAFLHETYLNVYIDVDAILIGEETIKRPNEPIIPDDIWLLIQRCLAHDAKDRPTIDEIVQEVESWM